MRCMASRQFKISWKGAFILTIIENIARWVSRLTYDEIPEKVSELAKYQFASVMGATFAGARSAPGETLVKAVNDLGDSGPCLTFPDGAKHSMHSALLQNCSLSMALDYDDYLFFGHTGHSAIFVPLAFAQNTDVDSRLLIAAQVAANEVAGRLGASVVIGPHNGQMWGHIHMVGAAVAASKMMGLDEEQTANAIGIALTQPTYSLFPGFMGSQSKILTAAVPAMTGAQAAILAEKGMSGSMEIIEDKDGFWANFSFVPLPFMLEGLGRSWVSETLAFKPYPGCAYVDAAVDALLEILNEFSSKYGRSIKQEEISEIRVNASLLTLAMDRMSKAYNSGFSSDDPLSPESINFSIPLSLAIVIISGKISGDEFSARYLIENSNAIRKIASRVIVEHDPSITIYFLRSLDEALDIAKMARSIDFRMLTGSLPKIRRHIRGVGGVGGIKTISELRQLSSKDWNFIFGLARRILVSRGDAFDLGSVAFERASMPFGARVLLTTVDGKSFEAERMIPRGSPGDPERLEVAREKFLREAKPFLGVRRSKTALNLILSAEERIPQEVAESLCSSKQA